MDCLLLRDETIFCDDLDDFPRKLGMHLSFLWTESAFRDAGVNTRVGRGSEKVFLLASISALD